MATTNIHQVEEKIVWTPCAICWGQRQVFVDCNGEGLVPGTCTRCMGVGEEARVVG